MGLAFAELDDKAEAIEHFQKALRFDPEFSVAFKDLGHVLSQKGDLDQALINLYEYVRRAPNDAEGRVRLAEALKANGDTAAAQEQYSMALTLQPDLSQKYATWPGASAKAGKLEAAIESYLTLWSY
jgi:tetratricopeptide (TPR) repeat protein